MSLYVIAKTNVIVRHCKTNVLARFTIVGKLSMTKPYAEM